MAIEKPKNPFRKGSQGYTFFELAKVDEFGFSTVVPIEELEAVGLGLGNGGGWCRSDGPLGNKFNINRGKMQGKISSVQLIGFKQNTFTNKIDKDIYDEYKDSRCRILSVGGKQIEIDHKDGRKEDYKLHDAQTLDDFQPLHKCCNVAKRRHCSACKETGIRFDARLLGYSYAQTRGPEKYHGSCLGCYWHDPYDFNRIISEKYIKLR